MKILLATDGSVYSESAVEEFSKRPFNAGTEVRIVSVFESSALIMTSPAPMGGLAGYFEEADTAARKFADDAVKKATKILTRRNPKLVITTAVVKGSPKQSIIKEAEEFGADLIVVGSHGRGAIGRFLLGSVSQSVALHAGCSVEIVRTREAVQ